MRVVVVASTFSSQGEKGHNDKDNLEIENDPHASIEIDSMDPFNHPRTRAQNILKSFDTHPFVDIMSIKQVNLDFSSPGFPKFEDLVSNEGVETNVSDSNNELSQDEQENAYLCRTYGRIHHLDMIEFLSNAWKSWVDLGIKRDACCFHPDFKFMVGGNENTNEMLIPPLIPQNFPLRTRIHSSVTKEQHYPQRPSKNVMGQMGYYCTDRVTPIVSSLRRELCMDAEIVIRSCFELITQAKKDDRSEKMGCMYALTTHPGHHAGYTSFGGYCYLNNAALAAQCLLYPITNVKQSITIAKKNCVAILDVDYHCGNGTAEIFYDQEDVMFVSIHCDPDIEYPFHSGYKDEVTPPTALYLPLSPGTSWEPKSIINSNKEENIQGYKEALEYALNSIIQVLSKDMGMTISALIVSLGLDTYDGDPVAVPGAGFCLVDEDYRKMGNVIGKWSRDHSIPVLFLQEGGYMMHKAGDIVTNILGGFVE